MTEITRKCDNGCIYCNEYHDDRFGMRDYCDAVGGVLTKDRKFFISMVGCLTYMKK